MKLPRFRYGLRFLIGVMLVIALSAAGYGNHLRALHRQNEAFQRIAEKGGWVLHYGEGTSIGFGQPPWKAPNSFLCGTGLHGVYTPASDEITFCDGDVSILENIFKVQSISFTGTQVSAAVQEQFKQSHRNCEVGQ